MASYSWNIRAGLQAAYTVAADWTGSGGAPGPGDVATIAAGGVATAGVDIELGMSAGQSGTLLLGGTGTTLTALGVGVGVFGTGRLAIAAGAALLTSGTNGVDCVGYEASGVGLVTIDGAGSVWSSGAAFLNVGYEGSAALQVSNGGALASAGYLAIDAAQGGTATLTAAGAGSSIAAAQGVRVDGGGGVLSVGAGATLTTGGTIDLVGDLAGAGLLTVSGAGALWREGARTLVVGDPRGTSLLTIAAGGTVLVGQSLQVGDSAMSGAIAVQAGGALLLTAASQNVGFLAGLGTASGSAGTITVSGVGATFSTGGNPLLLGGLGAGTLVVGAGGSASIGVSADTAMDDAPALGLGEYAASVGSLSVSGPGAQVNVAGGGFAGSGGTATIVVGSGGVLSVGDSAAAAGGFGLSIGAGAPAPGTTRTISGGSGTLTIAAGGTVVERNGFSVGGLGSSGVATIGAGGVLAFAGQMAVSTGDSLAGGGAGSVTVSAGGTLLALGATVADPLARAGLPALSIGQGAYGTAAAGTLTVSGAGAVVNTAGFAIAVGDIAPGDPSGGGGTGTLSVSGGASVLAGSPLAGGTALEIGVGALSAGTVSLSGAGSDLIATGAVAVGMAGTGALRVGSGAMLQAAALAIGTVAGGSGTVSVAAGATLCVSGSVIVGGAGAGTLSVDGAAAVSVGNVTIGAAGALLVNHSVAATQTIDFAAATGLLQLGDVAQFDGVVGGFVAGDTLDLAGMSGVAVSLAVSGADAILSFSDGGTLTLAGGYGVNGAGVPALLGMLETAVQAGAVSAIGLAAPGTATLGLTLSQVMADEDALRVIATPYAIDIAGVPGQWAGATVQSAGLGGSGLQYVQFADGELAFNTTSAVDEVYRMYLSAFGRVPDPGGQQQWVAALESGTPLLTAAQDFIVSPEFITRYGANVSNAAFVTLLYENVLGRPPDAKGLGDWIGAMGSGLSEAQMLVDFSESPEHISDTLGAAQGGLWQLDPNAAEVVRLYLTVFAQLPPQADLATSVSALDAGTVTLDQLAAELIASAAFQAEYGALSDTAFVTALYENALYRAPDPSGLSGWVGALEYGGVTRAQAVLAFSDSAEHEGDVQPDIINNNPQIQGVLTIGPVQASAAVVSAGLDVLQTEVTAGTVTAISMTDAGTATIAVTLAQLTSDATALRFINGNFCLGVGALTVEAQGAAVQADHLGTTTSAEYVQFANGRLVFNTADPAAEVYRMYLSAVGRVPDPVGEYGWTGALQSGLPLLTLAQDFLVGGEFMTRYGSNPTNTTLVTLLYENVLGRPPDPSGLADWVGTLNSGLSRAALLVDFSESNEHISDTAPAIHAGIWDAT